MDCVQYFSIKDVPGRYFECVRMGMISDTSCAASYTAAMSPKGMREGYRPSCRSCAIGAQHAGIPVADMHASRFLGSSRCARCGRDAARLIRGQICLSCYNRERELLVGKNAKGSAPVFAKPIFPVRIAFSVDGHVRVRLIERVHSLREAYVSVLRNETRSVVFGWVGRGVTR